ncbi:MAG: hypothetical protein JWR50_4370 [Mucilaginibacter sp.]|nr:hypothetical protein [Mucilaginibacter sp.]
MSAGGDILLGQTGQKMFRLFLSRQMKRKPFEEVARTRTQFRGERKMLAPDNFRKPLVCFIGIHTAILIHEGRLYINC